MIKVTRAMWIAALAPMLASVTVTEANALQRGAPVYPIGVDTLYTADLPSIPGLFLFDYALNYDINNVKDGHGNNLFGGFNGRVTGDGLRPLYVWDTTVFGARPISYVVVPILNQSFSASTINIPGGPTVPFSALNHGKNSQNITGLGDISIGQLLDWKLSKELSADVGIEVALPTGDYDKNQFFNIASTNYYTFSPNAAITWRSADNNHASLKIQYSMSTQNAQNTPGTLAPGIDLAQYHSGDFFAAEYAAGFGLSKEAGLDLVGYALVQTTSDSQYGVNIPNSKTRLFGLGPQFRYNIGPGAVAVKVEHEFAAVNSPQGNRIWIQFGLPLWLQNGPPPAQVAAKY